MTSSCVATGAVILAAGHSSRFGALKQLIDIDGQPMVRRIATNALAAGLHPVVVVVGAEGNRVIDCLSHLDVHPVPNAAWATGMGSSLATGAEALMTLAASLPSLMVLLADQPAISVDDLKHLLTAHAATPLRILACRHEGELSPPCIFPRHYVDELMALNGPSGARVLLERHATCVDGFDLPSAFCDIDTPADYESWRVARGSRLPSDPE